MPYNPGQNLRILQACHPEVYEKLTFTERGAVATIGDSNMAPLEHFANPYGSSGYPSLRQLLGEIYFTWRLMLVRMVRRDL